MSSTSSPLTYELIILHFLFSQIYRPLTPSSSIPSLDVVSPLSNIDLTNELINEADTISVENQTNPKDSSSVDTKESYWDKSPYVVSVIFFFSLDMRVL